LNLRDCDSLHLVETLEAGLVEERGCTFFWLRSARLSHDALGDRKHGINMPCPKAKLPASLS
jgi:hypothetical protein